MPQELAKIKADYNSGTLLTGEACRDPLALVRDGTLTCRQLKAMCIKHLQQYVGSFQERRAKVTDAIVDEFMSARSLEWKGNPKVPRADLVAPNVKGGKDAAAAGQAGGTLSKNQQKKMIKEQQIAKKKAAQNKAAVAGKAEGMTDQETKEMLLKRQREQTEAAEDKAAATGGGS